MIGKLRVIECECGQFLSIAVTIACPGCGKKIINRYDGAYLCTKDSTPEEPLLTRHAYNVGEMTYFFEKYPEEGSRVMLEWSDHSVVLDIEWMRNTYIYHLPMCWKPSPLLPLTNTRKGV